MRFLAIASAALSIFGDVQAAKSPFFILTGDSTVATGGGWGDALLNVTKKPGSGINLAKNGATTVSFRDQGLWGAAQAWTSYESIESNAKPWRSIRT
ncbi:unnamed protein product [Fusarium langsethiae]|nr:unnamed protein product [Fusarium langsethiae]